MCCPMDRGLIWTMDWDKVGNVVTIEVGHFPLWCLTFGIFIKSRPFPPIVFILFQLSVHSFLLSLTFLSSAQPSCCAVDQSFKQPHTHTLSHKSSIPIHSQWLLSPRLSPLLALSSP